MAEEWKINANDVFSWCQFRFEESNLSVDYFYASLGGPELDGIKTEKSGKMNWAWEWLEASVDAMTEEKVIELSPLREEQDEEGEKEPVSVPARNKRLSILSEATVRRMSSFRVNGSEGGVGYAGGAMRRARRRTATTQDHAKMCAMVQHKLKLGDIL